jgi:hypothetical protein
LNWYAFFQKKPVNAARSDRRTNLQIYSTKAIFQPNLLADASLPKSIPDERKQFFHH